MTAEWRDRAACHGSDPELFYPPGGGPAHAGQAAAKALCARCPVRDTCLADALARGDDWAILGGTTPTERRTMRRRERRIWPPGRAASLTPDQVRTARAEMAAGATRTATARRYGVSSSTMSSIALGRSWVGVA